MAMWVARGFCQAPGCHELAYSHHLCERHYGELTEKWRVEVARQVSNATLDGRLECADCGNEYLLADLESREGAMVCSSCSSERTEEYIKEMRAEDHAYWGDDYSDDDDDDDDEDYGDDEE